MKRTSKRMESDASYTEEVNNLKKLILDISEWMKDKVQAAGAEGIVVGMSGGLDSSVVAVISKMAFPETTLGLIIPCHSNPLDAEHARLVATKFSINTKEINISVIYEELVNAIEGKAAWMEEKTIALANLKPRLRMIVLYYFANKLNYLVAGTGNKSELMMGYFTKYGDGGADLLPLGDILKTEVKQIALEINIPEEIINKPPSAGLWEGQTDEGEMGISYTDLDNALTVIETDKRERLSPIIKSVKNKINATSHKRSLPFIFKVNKEINQKGKGRIWKG